MTFESSTRPSKGVTHLNGYCKVCGVLSTTLIHSRNQVLTRIHIKCLKHEDHLLNNITFEKPVSKCQCKDPDSKVWIDCTVGIEHPLPARYSVKRQFARSHWTLSPTNFDLEGRKKTTVNSVKSSSCMLEVDLYV